MVSAPLAASATPTESTNRVTYLRNSRLRRVGIPVAPVSGPVTLLFAPRLIGLQSMPFAAVRQALSLIRSVDDGIGRSEQRGRYGEADGPRRLEIDHQLEFR